MKGCRNCRHWQAQEVHLDRIDPATAGQKVQVGACRRYAPHPRIGGNDGGVPSGSETCPWPRVASDDWCGEWEPTFS